MSDKDAFEFVASQQVPKLVKDRLIRIETRLVKYQEANVVAIDELSEAVDNLCGVVQEVIYILTEAATNAETEAANE